MIEKYKVFMRKASVVVLTFLELILFLKVHLITQCNRYELREVPVLSRSDVKAIRYLYGPRRKQLPLFSFRQCVDNTLSMGWFLLSSFR